MPKFVDYPGRFAFFEEACFVVVRDHGVAELSRHRIAKVLGTSISTVRRCLVGHADLRALALREVEQRRRSGRYGRPRGEGPDAATDLLRRPLPDATERIAEGEGDGARTARRPRSQGLSRSGHSGGGSGRPP